MALGIPAQQRKHLYKIYSKSREKVESEDFINIHEQRAKPQDLMRLPKNG